MEFPEVIYILYCNDTQIVRATKTRASSSIARYGDAEFKFQLDTLCGNYVDRLDNDNLPINSGHMWFNTLEEAVNERKRLALMFCENAKKTTKMWEEFVELPLAEFYKEI